MVHHRLAAPQVPPVLEPGLALLRERLEVPVAFPEAVERQAEELLHRPPKFVDHVDRTDIEFVTVDPESSRDLDQAVCISRDGDGYLVHYAIADVGAWIEPGSPLDQEAWRRGETLYAPGAKVPLHPPALSEAAGSLLADGKDRPAALWTHRLAADGSHREVTVERAMVRSRAKLSYSGVQDDLDQGRAHPSVALLPEVGSRLQQLEQQRGGISLNLPDQEIVAANGTWRTEFRGWLAVEDYNAQISLLTGIAAARIMIDAGFGVIRTLAAASEQSLAKLRWAAQTLGVRWPQNQSYPDFVRSLDPGEPRELAVLVRCAFLFRGGAYAAIADEVTVADLQHAALASPYAHVTAPLRRLVDRYATEACIRVVQGEPIPPWLREGIDALPETMAVSNRRAKSWERGAVDLAETLVLQPRVGETFGAVLIDVNPKTQQGTFQIGEPAIEARLPAAGYKAGQQVRVRLDGVDLNQGQVSFSVLN